MTRRYPAAPTEFRENWFIQFGEHTIGKAGEVKDAIDFATRVVGWEHNVRIVAPNGVRLTVQAASLLA